MAAFDPDQFLASTAGDNGGFDPDQFLKETEPKSLGGFAQNAVQDVKDQAGTIGRGVASMAQHPIDTSVNMLEQAPGALLNEGKRLGAGELLTGHPINAVKQLGQAVYDKPVTTGLELAPMVAPAARALGLTEGAAPAAGEIAAAEKAIPAVEEAATAPKAPPAIEPEAPAAAAGPAPEAAGGLPKAIADPLAEVRDFVTKKYGQAAANPAWPQRVAQYLQEESQIGRAHV